MLKLSIFEWIFGAIPESFITIFFMYVFSLTKINTKRLVVSSLISSIFIGLIRLLPIQPGIHILVLIPIYVVILKNINKISISKGISVTILSRIILILCEALDMYILSNVLHLNIEEAFKNTAAKTFYSYIALIFYLIAILIFYFTLYKKRIKILEST